MTKYIHKALQKCKVCGKIVPKTKTCVYCGAWLMPHIEGTRKRNMKIKRDLEKKRLERGAGDGNLNSILPTPQLERGGGTDSSITFSLPTTPQKQNLIRFPADARSVFK